MSSTLSLPIILSPTNQIIILPNIFINLLIISLIQSQPKCQKQIGALSFLTKLFSGLRQHSKANEGGVCKCFCTKIKVDDHYWLKFKIIGSICKWYEKSSVTV